MCIVWHAFDLTHFVVLSKVTIQFFCRTAGLIAPIARPQGGILPSLCSMPLPDLFISLVPSYCHILLSFVHFRPLHTICWPLLLLIPYGLLIPYHLCVQYCLRYCFHFGDNLAYKSPQPCHSSPELIEICLHCVQLFWVGFPQLSGLRHIQLYICML